MWAKAGLTAARLALAAVGLLAAGLVASGVFEVCGSRAPRLGSRRMLSVAMLVLLGFALTGWSVADVTAHRTDAHRRTSLKGNVIFKDDFGNPKSGWPVGSDPIGAVGYTKGGYFIKVTKPLVSESSLATFAPKPRDVLVEVSAKNVTGASDTLFGVHCRARYLRETVALGYSFLIYNDGTYAVVRRDPTRVVTLTDGKSPKIPKRAALYRIGGSCVGSRLTLFVDDKKIVSLIDATYRSGAYGIRVGTDSGVRGLREVLFMRFVVRKE